MNEPLTLDRGVPTQARYKMLAWLGVMCLIAYSQRTCLAVFHQQIRADLKLTDDQWGFILSAFFWTYAMLQVPGAWLAERYGVRAILALEVLFWSASTAFTGMSYSFLPLIIARLGVGIGQAGAFPAGMLAISRWFPMTQRGLPSGVMTSSMLIGAAAGSALTASLLNVMSWRWILGLFSTFGVVWSIGFFLWFRETPREHPSVNDAELQEIGNLDAPSPGSGLDFVEPRNPWAVILSSPSAWLVFTQHFVRAMWTGFLVTQFPEYLKEAFQLSASQAGYFASGIVLIGVLGNSLGGALADWIIQRTGSLQMGRQGLAVGTMLVATLVTMVPAWVSNIWLAAAFFGLSNILAGVGGPAAYAVTIDIGGRHVSKVFATMNMVGNLGSAVIPILLTQFVQWRSWTEVPYVFAAVYLAAALCWTWIRTKSLFKPILPAASDA